MSDWRRGFLDKLANARQQWLERFEEFATLELEPVFEEFAEFTRANGFTAGPLPGEPGRRVFKFALTENGYALLTFRMRGLEDLEFRAESCVPGSEKVDPQVVGLKLCDVDHAWAVRCFEGALDRFVVAFSAAGCAGVVPADELVTA